MLKSKVFFIAIVFYASSIFTSAQDSLITELNNPPLFFRTNHFNLNANKNDLASAKASIFVNSEKRMLDGTYWRTHSDIMIPRLVTVLGSIVIIDAIAQKKQIDIWYTKETTKFHTVDFFLDFDRYKQMDKLGHFTDAFFVSDLSSKLYRWSGISGSSSVWFGALTGWLWTLQIEFYDAHSPTWGWSWGDIIANTLGAGFFVLQQFNYDLFGGIHPKYSYHQSEEWKKYGSKTTGANLIQDYSGMTFWLTVNPHHYFPDSWKKTYPKWLAPLGIAFGFGVNNTIFDSLKGERELFIGLDIDIRKIPIGDDSDFFRFIKSELNFIRLPLPTVRITPSGLWYGLYF